MYIIYLILSLFGITSPYATNENKHGEAHFQTSSQIASDMLENFHTKAESICLTAGNQSCSGGIVQQDHINDNSSYGKGIVSVSDGKTQVATFMPYSTAYRFNPSDISADVYNRINNITGKGINTGYYDQSLNRIIMKDGSTQPIPQGMRGFQLYNHMPVLITSLKGSAAAISRGATIGSSDTSVMNTLRNGGLNTTNTNNMVAYPSSFTCANGDVGTTIWNNISCGSGKNNIPSTDNNQVGETTNTPGVGGNNENGTGNSSSSNNSDDIGDDGSNSNTDMSKLNYSNDGTMKMGTITNSDTEPDDESDNNTININSGNNVPVASGYINNCKNIIYPQADPSKTGATTLGYSYNYDYYIDISRCNSFVRPSIDDLDSNYAVFPYNTNDVAISKQGWAYKVHNYQYFDWFGSDDEGVGIRNPQSSKWKANSNDCSVTLLPNIYNSSYADLEAMSTQSNISGTSDALNNMNCNQQDEENGIVSQGGENGNSLNDVNDDIQNIFSNVNGNQGPYFNHPFQYWGITWMCYPDTKDYQHNIIHYHVTCTPQINFTPQINNYTDYNIWKNFIGPNNYPLGGFFSIGHKGANNIAGQWPDSDNSDNSGGSLQYGINTDNGDYFGQAIASYYPFSITSSIQDSSTDGVSNVFYKYLNNKENNFCSANNYANAQGTVPSGDCSSNMNGILAARNRKFFDYTQALLQNESRIMNANNIKSESSSWDGSIIPGTAGFPKQDDDGVWRWHLADLQAPSFNTPSGTKIDSSTDSTNIKNGDYFSYTATVPANGIYGNTVNNVGNVSAPSDINFNNGTNISAPGNSPQTITTNGYSYSCQLGNYNGYDYTSGQLKYDVNCTISNVPTNNNNATNNNNNTTNTNNVGQYNVVCDYLGTYDLDSNNNGPPECISFTNPKGESDGNTYYYYLPNGSLPSNSPTNPATNMAQATLSSDQFTFGYVPGNNLSIGGNPASNRDWGDQINNGQYSNSNFTFNFSPNGLLFSNFDKGNYWFKKCINTTSYYYGIPFHGQVCSYPSP